MNKGRMCYVDKSIIDSDEYKGFLSSYYKTENLKSRLKKIEWYLKSVGYRILVAEVDNRYVGQSCAYMVNVVINGEEKEFWWSIDTFVLPSCRGLGIGKRLQKKLHDDCPNFSSASYSKANGIVKRKCGGKDLFTYNKGYYPISCFFSILVNSVLRRVSPRLLFPILRCSDLYYYLNKWTNYIGLKPYSYRELSHNVIFADDDLAWIDESMKHFDFYIKRTREFMEWKYIQNPNITYHIIEIIHNNSRAGLVFFSDDYDGHWLHSDVRLVMILDLFLKENTSRAKKAALLSVQDYFVKKGIKIDGILSLQNYPLMPNFKVPTPLLSTLNIDAPVKNPYLSYIDQDMDRMY